jgi:hypothetical protein
MTWQNETPEDLHIAEALQAIAGPVFSAVWSGGAAPRLVVHASADAAKAKLTRDIRQSLKGIGLSSVRIKFHKSSHLVSARSLEALLSRIDGARIVYDPTGSLVRARALLEASRTVRAQLPERTSGFYYAPMLRSFFVVLKRPQGITDTALRIADIAKIETTVTAAVRSGFAAIDGALPAVRVGFTVPKGHLVPVDAASVIGWTTRMSDLARNYWKPAAVAALFGFGLSAPAHAGGPAVSEPNLKVRGSVGEVIDDFTWNVEGAFTAPITERFGVAVEGGIGEQDGRGSWATAGHVFARDPESYLLGLFAAYSEATDFDIAATHVGGEFEFYFKDVTLSGAAGYQFSTDLGDKAFGSLDAKWYLDDNFALSGGGYVDKDNKYGRARAEWQPGFAALPGLAFNAEGIIGEDDYHSIMGGLTYYFGTPATLKDRHRRQDPDTALTYIRKSIEAEQARQAAYAPPPG